MKTNNRNSYILFPILILVGALVALAGGQGGATLGGVPVFAIAVGLAFLIQWLVFIPSYLFQTEKFFDLTGSLTYITVVGVALCYSRYSVNLDTRSILLAALVIIWALRLGAFLFTRIQKAGKDDRFDDIKPSFIRFLNVWTIQGLWITFTAAAALVGITTLTRKDLDVFAIIGFLVWVFGFVLEVIADAQKTRFNADPANKGKFIQTGLWSRSRHPNYFGFAFEVIADAQKSRFNANPENKGKFIHTGLWSRSRHPNYFGEIVLWVGIAIITAPVLQGWQWVAMISPIFVTFLLTRVSGIPMLEDKADKKWGGQEDYETYKKNTPVLIPRLTKAGK